MISSLTKSQADATEAADRNERRASEFQHNSKKLQAQLYRMEKHMKALEYGGTTTNTTNGDTTGNGGSNGNGGVRVSVLLDGEKKKRLEYEELYAETKVGSYGICVCVYMYVLCNCSYTHIPICTVQLSHYPNTHTPIHYSYTLIHTYTYIHTHYSYTHIEQAGEYDKYEEEAGVGAEGDRGPEEAGQDSR